MKVKTWTWGVKQYEKQICSRLFVKKVSDVPTDKDGFLSMEVDDILNAEKEFSLWRDRDRMWLSRK